MCDPLESNEVLSNFLRAFRRFRGVVCLLLATFNCRAAALTDVKTVFVIVMENHSWDVIKGDPYCPYINGSLLPIASYATQYFSPAGVHPSEANYIWMEAGTNFGIYDDAVHQINSTNHLTTLLDRAGISWRSYQESMDADIFPVTNHYPFVIRHCPQLLFSDVSSNAPYCLQHVRPYDELAADLESDRAARYNFITPNLTNDMHDFAPGFTTARGGGDYWLSHEVPKILNSNAYKDNGALFITWDEGTDFIDGPMGMIVISPLGKGGGYSNAIRYTHSSTLRTMQTIFQVQPFLGDAAKVEDLGDLFELFSLDAAISSEPLKLKLTINGVRPGQKVAIDSSPDLSEWIAWTTNTATSNSIVLAADLPNGVPRFFRASIQP